MGISNVDIVAELRKIQDQLIFHMLDDVDPDPAVQVLLQSVITIAHLIELRTPTEM